MKRKSNQKDIRAWVKDKRLIISNTNVSNIGTKISESTLSILYKNKIIKNGFIDMLKNNVAEELKIEIERQIIERCDKEIYEHKRRKMKYYIEKRFYRLFDYKKMKLSDKTIRSAEDYDKFPEPRIIIDVPFEKITWDQFIYSNVIHLTVYNIKEKKGINFEITDEHLLDYLQQFYENYLNNRGRKIPFRNKIEFYQIKPGTKIDCKFYAQSLFFFQLFELFFFYRFKRLGTFRDKNG